MGRKPEGAQAPTSAERQARYRGAPCNDNTGSATTLKHRPSGRAP